jgi:excisionase family DNA binding protein
MSKDQWYSRSDAAHHLGVSERTVLRMIERRELRGYKIGKVWKVRESDVMAYLEAAASMPEKSPEWVRELEFRLHGRTPRGVVEFSAGEATSVTEDMLSVLSTAEREVYARLARGGDAVEALQMVLAYAYLEREDA